MPQIQPPKIKSRAALGILAKSRRTPKKQNFQSCKEDAKKTLTKIFKNLVEARREWQKTNEKEL